MVALYGSATRPAGSDSHWPPVGTVVEWFAVQPVVDLATQALAAGWPILGTIGEKLTHLTKHGDHTPWSAGKKHGYVYAIDLAPPAAFEAWLVALCKSTADTSWIDFWNMNGSQYDHGGNWVTGSGDHHLHLSVAGGAETRHVTVITDYVTAVTAAAPTKTSTPTAEEDDMSGRGEDIYTLLHDGKRAGPAQSAGGGVPIAWIVREFKEVGDTLAQIKDALTKLSMDVAALKAKQ